MSTAITEDFIIGRETLLVLAVCSSLPLDEVKAKAAAHPCGTTAGWTFDEEFDLQGADCLDTPGHKHYLFDA